MKTALLTIALLFGMNVAGQGLWIITDSTPYQIDTTPVTMLVSDTSMLWGATYSIKGYRVDAWYKTWQQWPNLRLYGDAENRTIATLDQYKQPLGESIIVWISKEE